MIFLTVGTYPLQFNRLIAAVDNAVGSNVIGEEVFAQIGQSDFRPRHMDFVEMMEKTEFDCCFEKASGIVSHAGIGTITMAIDRSKALVVMPRLKRFKEHVNDHQLATARKFEELGHVLVAYQETQLAERINELGRFTPVKRHRQVQAVSDRISVFLNQLQNRR